MGDLFMSGGQSVLHPQSTLTLPFSERVSMLKIDSMCVDHWPCHLYSLPVIFAMPQTSLPLHP
jgi:hypothetical protein